MFSLLERLNVKCGFSRNKTVTKSDIISGRENGRIHWELRLFDCPHFEERSNV